MTKLEAESTVWHSKRMVVVTGKKLEGGREGGASERAKNGRRRRALRAAHAGGSTRHARFASPVSPTPNWPWQRKAIDALFRRKAFRLPTLFARPSWEAVSLGAKSAL